MTQPAGTTTRTALLNTAQLIPLPLLAATVVLAQENAGSGQEVAVLQVTAFAWAIFVLGALLLQRIPERPAVKAAVWGGALLQVVALRVPPFSTDDHLRYVWDGRVQAAGISPYRYVPGAPELAALRDAWLFPDGVTPALNHPDDRTVYPPVAQIWFWLVHILPGDDGRGRALQAGAAILAVVTSVALVRLLRRLGRDPRRVVWWSWCPVVIFESGGNAHVDILGAALTVAMLGSLTARRWHLVGALLGAAIVVKFLPALVAITVPVRKSIRVGAVAVLVIFASYLPHVMALGADVTGFLGGYLNEESRDRFSLIRFILVDLLGRTGADLAYLTHPLGWATLAALAGFAWRWVARDARKAELLGRPAEPWRAGAVLIGGVYLTLTPPYPWYGLLLVPMVALGGRAIWLCVPAGMYVVYAAAGLERAYGGTRVVGYGIALLVVSGWYVFSALRQRRHPTKAGEDSGDVAVAIDLER
ncbi:MAG: glycosyltransferase 87 family protein [Actinomycetota bacterium]